MLLAAVPVALPVALSLVEDVVVALTPDLVTEKVCDLSDDSGVRSSITDEVDLIVITDGCDEVREGVLALRCLDRVGDYGLGRGRVVGRDKDDLEGIGVGIDRGPGDSVLDG